MRVLVAEDQKETRELLVAFLEEWGLEAVPCADGLEAWEALQGPQAPSLVLLDWQMPGLDGLELCRRIRQRRDAFPAYIVFLTGKTRPRDLVECLQAGADDYIPKPFAEHELWARLQAGMRAVMLWDRVLAAERERVLAQTAGAMAHEISQPLSVILGQVQMMERYGMPADEPRRRFDEVYRACGRINDILLKMDSVRSYATKSYIGGEEIVDLDRVQMDLPLPPQ